MAGRIDIPFQDTDAPAGSHLRAAASPLRRAALTTGLGILAAVGWGLATYLYFVELPAARGSARVAMSLDLVDHFYDSPEEQAYIRLAEALKPWWASIEDNQRKIRAAEKDEERVALIHERDQSLITFIREKKLAGDVDLIISAFDRFTRCLQTDTCDPDVLRGTIGVDVRRLYRTFKPWIQTRRDNGEPDYGAPLEELFFRFSG